MYRFQDMNKSVLRLALVTVLGMVVALGNPFTVDAKEKISKRAMKEMIAGAKTAADHNAIADYYYAEAAKARANAVEHGEMAERYRKAGEGVQKTPYAPGTIEHCERLVKSYRASAEELTALANEHAAQAARISGIPFTPKPTTSEPAIKEKTPQRAMKEKASDRAMNEMIEGAKTAADHQAISDYYNAEAAKARAKADEHEQMAAWYQQAGEGAKKSPYAPGTIEHCQRLMKNYRATADELTALANEHAAMAARISGIPFTPRAKEKISELTINKEKSPERAMKEKVSGRAMKEMIAGAKTAADHKAIADYYYTEAAKARAKAVEHDEMAGWYRKAGEGVKKTPYAPGTIDHCERLVTNYKSTADDLTALAKEHEAMAAKVK